MPIGAESGPFAPVPGERDASVRQSDGDAPAPLRPPGSGCRPLAAKEVHPARERPGGSLDHGPCEFPAAGDGPFGRATGPEAQDGVERHRTWSPEPGLQRVHLSGAAAEVPEVTARRLTASASACRRAELRTRGT